VPGGTAPPPLAPLVPGSVAVWLAGDDDESAGRALPLLDDDERERLDRFVSRSAARQFAVAHGLARQALAAAGGGRPADWRLGATGHGQPVAAGLPGAPDLSVSLSHTGGLVAVAVATGTDVGVDVERHDTDLAVQDLVRFLAPDEAAAVAADPDAAVAFVRRWSLKEAYAKARGLGMSLPFESFTVTPGPAGRLPPRPAAVADGAAAGDGWRLWELDPGPDHAMAIALGPPPPGAPPPTVAVRRVVALSEPLVPDAAVVALPGMPP
jgi:4'-phosphopantetheinyl transferase